MSYGQYAPVVFCFTFIIVLYVYYICYLTWQKRDASVKKVDVIVKEIKGVMSPKEYKIVTFEIEFDGQSYISTRQSLWMRDAMPVNKYVGSKVILCSNINPKESCPYRPVREFFTTSMLAFIPISFCVLYWMVVLDMPHMN